MPRGWSSPQGDCSSGPVNDRITLSQPGISKDDIVFLSKVYYKEALDGILFIDPQVEVNLIADHPSLIVGPISVLSVNGLSESF